MLVIPYSTGLQLGRRPYVTWGVIALCLIIHLFAVYREGVIVDRIEGYCYVVTASGDSVFNAHWSRPASACQLYLQVRHGFESAGAFRSHVRAEHRDWGRYGIRGANVNQVLYRIEPYYNRVAASLPSFLQGQLYHDPRSLNPLPMLTSSLAHADWWHLAGNLVFFYAFAAPVEAVVGSLIFVGAFAALSFFVGIAYTVFCFFTGNWMPTLGLSGVVMGVIGMAGYLMPKARINTVLAAGIVGWKFAIPAWILAVFFVVSDLLDMFGSSMADSSVNFLAHVAGGIGGYLGAAAFLRRVKEQHQDDIDEAVELAAIDRAGGKGSLAKERISRRQVEAERRATAEREARERFQQLLFRLVSVDNSPRAVLLLLENYENWRCSPEIYEQLFDEIGEIKRGRTWLCVGRLCIHLNAEMGRFGKAVAIADRLAEVYPRLELCSPDQALQVAHEAIAMHRERLALALVQQPEQRYRGHLDAVAADHLLAQLV